MKTPKNPCINVCQFVGTNGWCTGCGRTRDECRQWKKLKPYKKQTLQKELENRVSKMKVINK
jgi:predicted Fe-S protein YdhL (DUF1289 family)